MKALIFDKGGATLGYYITEFKPIADDWYSWNTHSKQVKVIHEKCYFKLVINQPSTLKHISEEGVCAFCGESSPESVQQFVFLANAVKEYK